MSRFSSDLAVVVGDLFHRFGEQITYTPAGGSPVTITAVVEPETTEEEESFDGRRKRQLRKATILRDPSSTYGGVAAPSRTATVTIGSVVYAVESIDSESDVSATLKLIRRSQIEVTREKYRQR